jgi:hypothetical protein
MPSSPCRPSSASRICFTTCAVGSLTGPGFCLIVTSSRATMGQGRFPSSTHPICLMDANGGHSLELKDIGHIRFRLHTPIKSSFGWGCSLSQKTRRGATSIGACLHTSWVSLTACSRSIGARILQPLKNASHSPKTSSVWPRLPFLSAIPRPEADVQSRRMPHPAALPWMRSRCVEASELRLSRRYASLKAGRVVTCRDFSHIFLAPDCKTQRICCVTSMV